MGNHFTLADCAAAPALGYARQARAQARSPAEERYLDAKIALCDTATR